MRTICCNKQNFDSWHIRQENAFSLKVPKLGVPTQCVTTLSLTVFTLRNFVADSLFAGEVQFYTENGRFSFWAPFGSGFMATYDVYLRLIEKHVWNS